MTRLFEDYELNGNVLSGYTKNPCRALSPLFSREERKDMYEARFSLHMDSMTLVYNWYDENGLDGMEPLEISRDVPMYWRMLEELVHALNTKVAKEV